MSFSYPDDRRRIRLEPVLEGKGKKNIHSLTIQLEANVLKK